MADIGYLTWEEVNRSHKTQRAVYNIGIYVHSILCTSDRKNVFYEGGVRFALPKSYQYATDFSMLMGTFNSGKQIRVYRKVKANVWIYLGRGLISNFDDQSITDYVFDIKLIPKVEN